MAIQKKDKEYTAKDLYNLSFAEIEAIQNEFNVKNILTIEKAFQQHRINDDERTYLLDFYRDGMEVYREVYRSLYETFGQPENTCSFDPLTGNVDTDANGNDINYGLKVVTPFVNTRLEYQDKNNNPIFVIFPKMKSAERAIEKLESEYSKDYSLALAKALNRMFEDDDREAFAENLRNIPQKTSNLHDILRLTITCKYLSDVQRLKRKLSENRSEFYSINSDETRDRFFKPLKDNPKRYYDIKMLMHQQNNDKIFDVEIQLKIDTLYQGDIRTHRLYEDVRKLEAQLPADKNKKDTTQTSQIKAQIEKLTTQIRQINENSVHQYNMMVLDKARRIEDDGYRPLRITPEFSDGTYKKCRSFIANEYLVESFDEFDGNTAFSADNPQNKLCFLRMIGKFPTDFNEFSASAQQQINKEFTRLSPAELNRFNGINEVAKRYQSIIRRRINEKQKQEQPEGQISTMATKKGKSL